MVQRGDELKLVGHSFQVEVAVRGEPDPPTGFIVDFAEFERACAEVRRALDHNDIEGLEKPSLEKLCAWIWRRLAPRFASLAHVTVRRDSAGQSCSYSGERPLVGVRLSFAHVGSARGRAMGRKRSAKVA